MTMACQNSGSTGHLRSTWHAGGQAAGRRGISTRFCNGRRQRPAGRAITSLAAAAAAAAFKHLERIDLQSRHHSLNVVVIMKVSVARTAFVIRRENSVTIGFRRRPRTSPGACLSGSRQPAAYRLRCVLRRQLYGNGTVMRNRNDLGAATTQWRSETECAEKHNGTNMKTHNKIANQK